MPRVLAAFLALFVFAATTAHAADAPATQTFDIRQTVMKVPVEPGLTAADVKDSIMATAMNLNMKFVGSQPLSQELQSRGVESGHLEIFQFCNPLDARKMVDHNIIFAAYMPCRIVLVEDKDGQLWLEMIDLDFLIDNAELPPEVKDIAVKVSDMLKKIVEAGRVGDF